MTPPADPCSLGHLAWWYRPAEAFNYAGSDVTVQVPGVWTCGVCHPDPR